MLIHPSGNNDQWCVDGPYSFRHAINQLSLILTSAHVSARYAAFRDCHSVVFFARSSSASSLPCDVFSRTINYAFQVTCNMQVLLLLFNLLCHRPFYHFVFVAYSIVAVCTQGPAACCDWVNRSATKSDCRYFSGMLYRHICGTVTSYRGEVICSCSNRERGFRDSLLGPRCCVCGGAQLGRWSDWGILINAMYRVRQSVLSGSNWRNILPLFVHWGLYTFDWHFSIRFYEYARTSLPQ